MSHETSVGIEEKEALCPADSISHPSANPLSGNDPMHLSGRDVRKWIPPGARVLEVGCGPVSLREQLPNRPFDRIDLAPPGPEAGPVDAKGAVPRAGWESLSPEKTYDFLLLPDSLSHLPDTLGTLKRLQTVAMPETRLILTTRNPFWRPLQALARKLGLRRGEPEGHWLSTTDLHHLLELSGWAPIRTLPRILLPRPVPGLDPLLNRCLAPLLGGLCRTRFTIARPRRARMLETGAATAPKVSVILPVQNDAARINALVERIPAMGAQTEILFVEGNSSDRSWEVIEAAIHAHPEKDIRAFRQSGRGRENALALGCGRARGDLFILLDAHQTSEPEVLSSFYDALMEGHGDYIQGNRLVYAPTGQPLGFLSSFNAWFFGKLCSWSLRQPVKDPGCRIMALWKSDYLRLTQTEITDGKSAACGGLHLLMHAVAHNLQVRQIPVQTHIEEGGEIPYHSWREIKSLLRFISLSARKVRFF